ncbi:MAG: redoxin domain-containing protein [Chloroflexota bacterium]|nr:MAG: redoxin domain-containing protein [Chloroflexota bacterium]
MSVLAAFAERWGITYRLLSDEGSHAIRSLGLYNEHLAEQAAAHGVQAREHHYGVPYPGTFVLDEAGVIVDKWFEQSYRVRPSGAVTLEKVVGAGPAQAKVSAQSEANGIAARAWLADDSYRPYQQLLLHVVIEPAPGVHVYGDPIPDGYQALRIEIQSLEGLVVGPIELPTPATLVVPGLDDSFVGYERAIDVTIPFSINGRLGPVALGVSIVLQACDDTVCYPPAEIRLALPLDAEENIRD